MNWVIEVGQQLAMRMSTSWDDEEFEMMFASDLKLWLADEVASVFERRRSTECFEKKGDANP